MIKQGIYTLRTTFPTPGTFWLMSDVGRGSRAAAPPAPAMTSLVRTSTWISRKPSLAARHGFEAAMWRITAARLRNRHRLDSWPVSVHLAPAGRRASESWRSRAGRLYTDSTCHDCHCDQQEPEGGDGPYGTIRFVRAAGLTLNYTGFKTYSRAGMRQKKIKTFLQQKRV